MIEYSLKEAEKVWFISDIHFDHANIIKYCSRPFKSTEEMNTTIGRNWNNTIVPNDVVYFLGDMAFGRGSRKSRWWPQWLNGRITWVKGSHDYGVRPSSVIDVIVPRLTKSLLIIISPIFISLKNSLPIIL